MPSVYTNIRKALEVELNNISGLPDIAWENTSFNPDSRTSYIKPRFFPTVREPAIRGNSPQQYYQGMFRVECCVPIGLGPSAADNLADTIIDNFDATTDINDGGSVNVRIRYAEREIGADNGSHYIVNVNIGWYCYSN